MAEHNLIQAPELLRRLARRLGLRQAHVSPTLNEGVQAVILVDDVTAQKSESLLYAWAFTAGSPGDTLTKASTCALWNPPGSGRRARVLTYRGATQTGLAASGVQSMYMGPYVATAYPGASFGRYQDTALAKGTPVCKVIGGNDTSPPGGATSLIVQSLPVVRDTALGPPYSTEYLNVERQGVWLEPGFALFAQLTTVLATDFIASANFTWYEEDLT